MQSVTLHGFTGSTASWPEEWNATHFSLTGHTKESFFVGGESFDTEVNKISNRICNPTHLIGYSCGGRLALAAALTGNPHIKKLTLISTNPGLESTKERDSRFTKDNRWIQLLENNGTMSFVKAWENLPLWDSQKSLPQIKLEKQRTIRQQHDALQLSQSLKVVGLAAMPNFWPLLSKLALPLQIVVGAKDPKFSKIAQRIKQETLMSKIYSIPNSGHNPILEAPEELENILWGLTL